MVILLGPGNIEYHFFKLLEIPEEKLYGDIKEIAKALCESSVEIVLLPDKGISFEIAKEYRKLRGKKFILQFH